MNSPAVGGADGARVAVYALIRCSLLTFGLAQTYKPFLQLPPLSLSLLHLLLVSVEAQWRPCGVCKLALPAQQLGVRACLELTLLQGFAMMLLPSCVWQAAAVLDSVLLPIVTAVLGHASFVQLVESRLLPAAVLLAGSSCLGETGKKGWREWASRLRGSSSWVLRPTVRTQLQKCCTTSWRATLPASRCWPRSSRRPSRP